MNNIVSFISNEEGQIIHGNNNFVHLPQSFLSNLSIELYEKKLLANMLERNYVICKLPLMFENRSLYHWIFETWKIGSNIQINHANKYIEIKPKLKSFFSFTEFEQEIIYTLLTGHHIDKDIISFLEKLSVEIKGNIKYTISSLFDKFNCNNRTDLVYSLKAHELNYYLPKSIFPSGEYILN